MCGETDEISHVDYHSEHEASRVAYPSREITAMEPEVKTLVADARTLREKLLSDRYRPTYHFVTPEGSCMPFDPDGDGGTFSGNCFVNKRGEATMLYHGMSAIHHCLVRKRRQSNTPEGSTDILRKARIYSGITRRNRQPDLLQRKSRWLSNCERSSRRTRRYSWSDSVAPCLDWTLVHATPPCSLTRELLHLAG